MTRYIVREVRSRPSVPCKNAVENLHLPIRTVGHNIIIPAIPTYPPIPTLHNIYISSYTRIYNAREHNNAGLQPWDGRRSRDRSSVCSRVPIYIYIHIRT